MSRNEVYRSEDAGIVEKIDHEERIFTGHLIKVNRLDVTLPTGAPAMREVVRHPGASAIVPVDAQGNVTLVRQFRAALGHVLLEIPAGKLDYPGEDRLEAAKRELHEETGLTAQTWTHLTDIATTCGFCDEIISIYLAENLCSGETDPDEDEFLNIIKMPLSELNALIARGEICDSKTIAGALLAERHLKENGHGV